MNFLEKQINDFSINDYLKNQDIISLSAISPTLKSCHCKNSSIGLIGLNLLIHFLNEYLLTKAQFITKLKSYHLKHQLPNLTSFILKNCHCLIICKFTNEPHNYESYRISHPNCNNTDHSDVFLSPILGKHVDVNISVTENSILFLNFQKNAIIYYEFNGESFFCHQNEINDEEPQRFQYYQKQFRIVGHDGCSIYSFDCKLLETYRNPMNDFIVNGVGYYGLKQFTTSPLHYVTWGPFIDNLYDFWIADLKNQKFYSFNFLIKLNPQTSYHLTDNNQIIMIPNLVNSNHLYYLYKFDLNDHSIWEMEIDFSVFPAFHNNIHSFNRGYFCLVFITDNFVNITMSPNSFEHLFWLNLDSYSWTKVEVNSIFKLTETPLMFEDQSNSCLL